MLEVLEREAILESMFILCDTREQPSDRQKQRCDSFGVPYRRQTLNYGDYTYNFCLNGSDFFPEGITIGGDVVIERKMNLEELSMCFTSERDRFRREFERIKEANAKPYLLIEDGSWERIINHRYKTQFAPKAFLASLTAWMVRYDCSVVFCQKEISGRLIKEILYRELKERLDLGFYG